MYVFPCLCIRSYEISSLRIGIRQTSNNAAYFLLQILFDFDFLYNILRGHKSTYTPTFHVQM